jgi:hypothetical protein
MLSSEVISLGLADGRHWGFVQQEGTFFRQHVWQTVGVQEAFSGMRLAGDWNLWRLIAKDHKIFQFKVPTGMFLSREGQQSQTGQEDYEREVSTVVSPDDRVRYLLDLKGINIDAHYFSPDVKTGFIIESKPIDNYLLYRNGKLPVFTKDAVVTGSISKYQENADTEPNLPSRKKDIGLKPQRDSFFISYDAEWQFPAITEQHAFHQAKMLLSGVLGTVYFAFPWATLIDLLNKKKEDATRLSKVLEETKRLIKPGERVVTVCQHIQMLKYQNMFADMGITDVFWAHAIKKQAVFPKHPTISIYPFPLYPVQAVGENMTRSQNRPILYSFVGAKATKWYLTQSRDFIIDNLGGDKRGIVVGRDNWHYERAVYEHQIDNKPIPVHELVDKSRTKEFKDVLKDSVFSLCPSGSGPNSIRLWESIGLGTIPVILADTYLPPGDHTLWEEAVVFCSENLEDIKILPDRLEEIASDSALIDRKRRALKQLWMMYGPDCFIYDIQKLFLKHQGNLIDTERMYPNCSYKLLLNIAKSIVNGKNAKSEELIVFLLGCSSRAIIDPGNFSEVYISVPEFREALSIAMAHCNDKQRKSIGAVFSIRGIVLDLN